MKTKWIDEKKNIKKTGGGSYDPILTDADHQILSIVDDHIRPDKNEYDDAAEYFGKIVLFCLPINVHPTRAAFLVDRLGTSHSCPV